MARRLSLSLAAAQLVIAMASLLLGYVAEPAVAAILEEGLGFLHISGNVLHPIALIIALAIVVFLHMVIGEMVPKNIAIADPERTALAVSLPFRGFILLFRPVISLLNGTANGVLRLLRVKPADVLEAGHAAEALAILIAEGRREGVIGDFAHRLLTGAIVFGDRDAFEVMVPRPDTVAVSSEATVAEIEEGAVRAGHSRIPVHTGDLDDVVGFVHVKDLLVVDEEDRDRPPHPSLIRPLLVVPETVRVSTLLTRMRRAHSQMALVIDEHGGASGIITLEDIAEELVGDIWDEYDRQPTLVRTLADGSLVAALGVPTLDGLGPSAFDVCSRRGRVILDRLHERALLLAHLMAGLGEAAGGEGETQKTPTPPLANLSPGPQAKINARRALPRGRHPPPRPPPRVPGGAEARAPGRPRRSARSARPRVSATFLPPRIAAPAPLGPRRSALGPPWGRGHCPPS